MKTFIEHGALVGVVADYAKLGRAVAGIVHRHQQGEALRHIPVQTVQEPLLIINQTSSDHLKLTIPDSVRKQAIMVE